jgi:hypothetical protein
MAQRLRVFRRRCFRLLPDGVDSTSGAPNRFGETGIEAALGARGVAHAVKQGMFGTNRKSYEIIPVQSVKPEEFHKFAGETLDTYSMTVQVAPTPGVINEL